MGIVFRSNLTYLGNSEAIIIQLDTNKGIYMNKQEIADMYAKFLNAANLKYMPSTKRWWHKIDGVWSHRHSHEEVTLNEHPTLSYSKFFPPSETSSKCLS